jgi:hypothetical protein
LEMRFTFNHILLFRIFEFFCLSGISPDCHIMADPHENVNKNRSDFFSFSEES